MAVSGAIWFPVPFQSGQAQNSSRSEGSWQEDDRLMGQFWGHPESPTWWRAQKALSPFCYHPSGLFERTKFCKANLHWQSQTQTRLRFSLPPECEKWTAH